MYVAFSISVLLSVATGVFDSVEFGVFMTCSAAGEMMLDSSVRILFILSVNIGIISAAPTSEPIGDDVEENAGAVDDMVDIVAVYKKLKAKTVQTGYPAAFQGDITLNDAVVNYISSLQERDRHHVNSRDIDHIEQGDNALERMYFKWQIRWRRAAHSSERFLWPNATIPYSFHSSYYTAAKRIAKKAMAEWEKMTCIRFVPRQPSHTDYVTFKVYGFGCSSDVGRSEGEQFIFASRSCAIARGSIMHELGHVIGFWHEHSRPDRNRHIRIIWDNIMDNEIAKENFRLLTRNEVDSLGVPYDYNSIMHYSNYAFSRGGNLRTIEVRDPTYRGKIGQRKRLSPVDVLQANLLYGCLTPTSPPPAVNQSLSSTISKDDKIALKLVDGPNSWMACNKSGCNVSHCPDQHFSYSSSVLACSPNVFSMFPMTSANKPLVDGDLIVLGSPEEGFVICNRSTKCATEKICYNSTTHEYNYQVCKAYIIRINVVGKSRGELVQHRDRIILEFGISRKQWIGCRERSAPVGCRRRSQELTSQNTIRVVKHEEFIIYKLDI